MPLSCVKEELLWTALDKAIRWVLQAKQDKFKASVEKDSASNTSNEPMPFLVDRHNPAKPLDPDASLQESVLKEPQLDFAAIFSSIKLLPTAVANAVPSQTSGAALTPPSAFQVHMSGMENSVHEAFLQAIQTSLSLSAKIFNTVYSEHAVFYLQNQNPTSQAILVDCPFAEHHHTSHLPA